MDQRNCIQIDLPAKLSAEFSAISAENQMHPSEFAKNVIEEYVSNAGILPPSAELIVQQLKKVQGEFENEGVVHLKLFGSVARNEAKRGSDIDLLAEFNCIVGLKEWVTTIEIAERAVGEMFEIDLLPQKFLRDRAYKSAMNDAIKIF